jgi:hypothetical protein
VARGDVDFRSLLANVMLIASRFNAVYCQQCDCVTNLVLGRARSHDWRAGLGTAPDFV